MLRNCDKMVLISTTTNECSNQFVDHNMGSLVADVPPPRVIDQKVATFSQQQQQQQEQNNNNNQEPLRCPRCDSSNTKFCYYNNYSLSQPRHFCKGCKRYWTRGGTLRSVPVGGGCRKNKRVKRPSNNLKESLPSSANSGGNNVVHDLISSNSSNPLIYGLHTNHNLINFPFSRYDLDNSPQINNGLRLGFPNDINLQNNKQFFQDLISSNYTNTNSTTPSTISSLLASTFDQMKGGSNNFHTLMPSYEESGQGGMFITKDVKREIEGQNRSFDHHWSAPSRNQMDHNMGSSSCDPSIIWGSGPNLGAWLDPSNNHLGSSISSLI